MACTHIQQGATSESVYLAAAAASAARTHPGILSICSPNSRVGMRLKFARSSAPLAAPSVPALSGTAGEPPPPSTPPAARAAARSLSAEVRRWPVWWGSGKGATGYERCDRVCVQGAFPPCSGASMPALARRLCTRATLEALLTRSTVSRRGGTSAPNRGGAPQRNDVIGAQPAGAGARAPAVGPGIVQLLQLLNTQQRRRRQRRAGSRLCRACRGPALVGAPSAALGAPPGPTGAVRGDDNGLEAASRLRAVLKRPGASAAETRAHTRARSPLHAHLRSTTVRILQGGVEGKDQG